MCGDKEGKGSGADIITWAGAYEKSRAHFFLPDTLSQTLGLKHAQRPGVAENPKLEEFLQCKEVGGRSDHM